MDGIYQNWIKILALFLSFNFISSHYAFSQIQNRLNKLDETIQRMELSVREMTEKELEFAIAKNEELLQRFPDSEFTPTVLFQLSELYVKKARQDFEKAMEQYEQQLKQYDKGRLKIEPVMPRVNFGDAISTLYEILNRYPNISFKDRVLYRIALCHHEEGNGEKSKQYFERLISEVPGSPFVAEAYFRIGEYYFDQGQYESAIRYYSHLVTEEMWHNSFFDMALYKLGWANYKINKYPEAISAFMYLLKDIQVLEHLKTQTLNHSSTDLRQEALDYIAISFSEYGGPERAKLFLQATPDNQFTDEILKRLGEVYLKQDRLDEAVETFRAYLGLFPFAKDAPKIQKKIIDAYEKQWNLIASNKARSQLIRNYGPNSLWYQKVSDQNAKAEALKLVKDALYKSGIYHQLQAREANNDRQELLLAIQKYRQFLKDFPDDERADKINYFLAECLYAIGDYETAAQEYKKVVFDYKKSSYQEQAAYNCILSYDKALQLCNYSRPEKFYLQHFYNMPDSIVVEAGNPVVKNFIQACEDFVTLLPKSDHVTEILMKEAQIFNDIDRYDLARKIYLKIITEYANSPYAGKAMMMIAQSYFNEENYIKAEQWYSTVVNTLPDTAALVRKAEVMMSSSRFKLAEKYRDSGNHIEAAKQFALAAMRYPKSKIAEAALIEAAKQFEYMGDTTKAAQVYEKFLDQYPYSNLLEEAVFTAAKYRESVHQWDKAAKNYLRLRFKNSPLQAQAIFAAGKCYYNLKDWTKVVNIFNEYLVLCKDDNRFIEALSYIGEGYLEQGQEKIALQTFRQLLNKFNSSTNREATLYFAAKAQFMIGEIYYREYSKITIQPPLKTTFQRKKESLTKVIKSYAKAAKYRIAEWTTAASFRIGQVFEEFANALLTSPIPEGLTPDELVAYELQIKDMALPFQKKALETYTANVNRAEKNNVNNTWVSKSRDRIRILGNLINQHKHNQ